jgi:hypothetical protein
MIPPGGPVALDYPKLRKVLAALFEEAQQLEEANAASEPDTAFAEQVARVFDSATQSYREALLGCALVAVTAPQADLTKPYKNHGDGAFNGRTLDEQVVNPFLRSGRFPSSRGPYLATLRRSVRLNDPNATGHKDKAGYLAFLNCISALQASDFGRRPVLARHICRAFVRLRAASDVALTRPRRLSVEQLRQAIHSLLAMPSGGRLPVFLVAASLNALNEAYGLRWTIEVQGINAADSASGAGGDIVVRDTAGRVAMAIEVTERVVDAERVAATFDTKIAEGGIGDYLFLHGATPPDKGAYRAAFPYFAQGHDISFHAAEAWLVSVLTILGESGRAAFLLHFLDRLAEMDVPVKLKLGWNELAAGLTSAP